MSADEVLIPIEENGDLLGENYAFLPYIKVDGENVMIFDDKVYDEEVVESDTVLCINLPEPLFDYTLENEASKEYPSNESSLRDHNYHFPFGEDANTGDAYWANFIKNKMNSLMECSLCQKVMKTPGAFYRHLRTHTGEKPFQCELCNKKFSQHSNLWKHILIHTGERRFECSVCNRKFSQRTNMQKHEMIHSGVKPFECYICSKTFTQRANLNKHIRIHTGEKPYVCKYCHRQFAQQSNMQKHEILHQGIRPFTCTICSLTFTQQSNLKKHMATHKNDDRVRECKYRRRKEYKINSNKVLCAKNDLHVSPSFT